MQPSAVVGPLLKRLISRRRLSEADLHTVIDLTIQKALEALGAEAITLYRVEGNRIRFERVQYAPSLYEGDAAAHARYLKRAEALQKMTLPLGQGLVGMVIAEGRPHLAADAKADSHFSAAVDQETGFRTRSALTVPLVAGKKTLGAIQVLNKSAGDGRFTPEDQRLLEEVAGYSAAFMARVLDPEREVDEEEVAAYVARLSGCDRLPADPGLPEEALVKLAGEPLLRRHHILPLARLGADREGAVKVAMANPLDVQGRDSFEAATRLAIGEVLVASPKALAALLDRCFKRPDMDQAVAMVEEEYTGGVETVAVEADANEESAPIVQLANRIVEDAYARGASDIHIEPFEDEVVVRYRIDGELTPALRLPARAASSVTARFKIMSDLDISERRMPQDGRIRFKRFTRSGIDIDLRVSIGPMTWGEKVVMRILDKTSTRLGLDVMGFSDANLTRYRELIRAPYGMILHVGPTGSGKTTTLYAALQELNDPSINIQTAEDPVEYQLKGVSQMQMHARIGLTFAAALRCFLRQDPDVILVGEIRDPETAKIAIEASLTGHLLFSTLHTNDAAGTVTRFLDMGVEPFLISSSLLTVCAQRLIRRLCPKCKEPYAPEPAVLAPLGVDWPAGTTLYRAKGCPACRDTGYKGRVGVHELLVMNDALRVLTNERASAERIRAAAAEGGMATLYQDALEKARIGLASLDEVLLTVRKD